MTIPVPVREEVMLAAVGLGILPAHSWGGDGGKSVGHMTRLSLLVWDAAPIAWGHWNGLEQR